MRINNNGLLSNIPPVTLNLLIINIILFLASMFDQYVLGTNILLEKLALFYPASYFFRPWQLLTHMFMHGGFWHIFFNMYTLLIFGMVVERTIGSKKFLVFYFITGIGAMLLHLGVEYLQLLTINPGSGLYWEIVNTPTVGASGAIYGVLIAFAMLFPNAELMLLIPPIPIKAKWAVLIFAAIELFTGITGTLSNVAHFAHLGGMLFGYLMILYWKKSGRIYDSNSWF